MIQQILVADLVYSVLSHNFAQGSKSHLTIRLREVAGFVFRNHICCVNDKSAHDSVSFYINEVDMMRERNKDAVLLQVVPSARLPVAELDRSQRTSFHQFVLVIYKIA